jgi:hypothetical protein
MWISSAAIPLLCKNSIRIACCTLLFWSASVTGQEYRSNSPASAAVEQEALKVLNDSDWAHTVKPGLQDTPCTYQNAVFPDLYPKEQAFTLDATAPTRPPDPVKADDSEYLVRFQSAKPVQTAVQALLAIGEEWSGYGSLSVPVHGGPTDLANGRYNVADLITIAVILKRSGPDGTSLFSYGYEDNGRGFPSHSFRLWPCAGLRTTNLQAIALVVPEAFGHDGKSKVLQLSFQRLIHGKPLISSLHEKVEFRMVANQRVFETTFYINASDVLDGSEKTLYLPSVFTDPKEIPQHQPIAESKF